MERRQGDPPQQEFRDWETPCGPEEAHARPSHARPAFTYQGHGDAHWHGQACRVVTTSNPDECLVIPACGCQAHVAWRTLEPLASAVSKRAAGGVGDIP